MSDLPLRVYRVQTGSECGELVTNGCCVVVFADACVAHWLGEYWRDVKAVLEEAGGRWEDLGPDDWHFWNEKCQAPL